MDCAVTQNQQWSGQSSQSLSVCKTSWYIHACTEL